MATVTIHPTTSYIEWSGIVAGTVVACAISSVLVHFGDALGLSFTALHDKQTILPQQIVMIGLWVLWLQLMASMAGGYLAGRVRAPWNPGTHESELRDGAHGLLVWALSTVLVAIALAVSAFWASLAVQHGAEVHAHVSDQFARKIGIISGFGLAATSIVSAVAAWAMAVLGGDHRDAAADVSRHVSFRRTVKAKR